MMTREDEIRAEVEQRLAREQRIYARLRAEALAAVDAEMTYRRTYGCSSEVKAYGSPWMEGRFPQARRPRRDA